MRGSLTLTWQVTPLQLGTHRVSIGATGVFTDVSMRSGPISAPAVSVEVVGPTAVVPSSTPTQTPTQTPSLTPTPEPIELFIPVVERP
jgi:hypothetical protein